MYKDKVAYFEYFSNLHRIVNKEDKICELSRGKKVLDLGCIDHSHKTAMKLGNSWLHKRIIGVAKKVTGVDILTKDIKVLNNKGYRIIKADVETMSLNEKYDVIVAGDLIEHLSNIGSFLKQVKTHMHRDSIFIITTPNPFNIEQFLSILFDNRVAVNPEHTVWLDPKVMFETVQRSGLIIDEFFWARTRFGCHVQNHLFFAAAISKILRLVRPAYERDYMVVLKKKLGSRSNIL